MQIDRINEIVIIAFCPEALLWKALRGTDTKEYVNGVAGIGNQHVANWSRGVKINALSRKRLFVDLPAKLRSDPKGNSWLKETAQEARHALADALERCLKAVDDPGIRLTDIAGYVGLPIHVFKRVLDEAVYSRLPLLSSVYYTDREKALEDFEHYQGLYRLACRRGSVWLEAMLHIRYLIDIRNGIAIRCKMNFPKIKSMHRADDVPHWQYDGFLSLRASHAFWFFEKRQKDRGDYFTFVTCMGRMVDGVHVLSGTYLTTGQDKLASIVSGDVLMRQEEGGDVAAIEREMQSGPTVVDGPSDVQRLDEVLAAFRNGAEG